MKIASLSIGLIIGLVLGFGAAKFAFPGDKTTEKPVQGDDEKPAAKKWTWPDSLDAVKAASSNHRVVFENDKIRILEVLLRPHEFETMHTHRLPSVMFSSNASDLSPFDIVYYIYGYDSLKHQYYVKKIIKQHNPGSKAGTPDSGYFMKPEGPHAIKNLSNVLVDVFRIEFKK